MEPKEEIKFTPDYEAGEPIFWRIFKELANDNKNLGSYDKLQERLISTGKFYAGESVLMIEHMEKIGKIEQTEQYHLYRKKSQKLDLQNAIPNVLVVLPKRRSTYFACHPTISKSLF